MSTTNTRYFYFLSFLEGGSVMACELAGAKALAPYFGTSLYVWAAALALTLGGLMTGYFTGGILSKKYVNDERLLYWVLIAAGAALVLMPFTSKWIMQATIDMSLQMGAIISLLIFMFPPLVFMGMTSPIIINLLTAEAKKAGNSAGNVYAISTLGGILFTFLMGFFIIPEFGINMPVIVVGILLALFPALSLIRGKTMLAAGVLIGLISLGSWKIMAKEKYPENYKVHYHSEGILGQVKVVDHPAYEFTEDNRLGRGLIVNNTLQTFVGLDHDLQYSIWSWSHYFPAAASIYPEGSEVLLLGLGGGTLVKQFNRLGFNTDVVEIDKRIYDVSVDYFNLDPATNVIIDDARHYIKTTDKKYDIVIFDTFLSESVPEHLLTLEGFEDAKKCLKPGGMIMSNFYGFTNGDSGKAARSVYKTFLASGLKTKLLATPGGEDSRNLVFLASETENDFSNTRYDEPGAPELSDLTGFLISPKTLDISDAIVLRDSSPILSKLYAQASMQWRRSYNDYYQKHFFNKK